MRGFKIWAAIALCTIAMTVAAQADVTVSCAGPGVAQTAAASCDNTLNINHLQFVQFVVERGRADSVSVLRSNPFSWGGVVIDKEEAVTTFSGDDDHATDYYENELMNYLSRERELNAPRVLESRTIVGDREVLTIAVIPFEIDSISGEATGFADIGVKFWGTDDLLVRQIGSAEELIQLTREVAEDHLKGPRILSALGAETPEYLIVTGEALVDAFAPLAEWKTMKGLTVEIVPVEEILTASAGIDDAEKLRNFLIEKYNAGTRYVLLGGDESVVPIRYAFASNTSSMPAVNLLQICDLYFADVNGVWDVDGDGVYGEPTQDSADLNAELLVGRLPLCTSEQVSAYVSKLIKYEQNPNDGDYAYLNKSLFVAADQMRDYSDGVGEHVLLAQSLPAHVMCDTTELIEAPSGIADDPSYPSASPSISKLSEGWGIVSLLIHGRIDGWVIRSNRYNEWPKSFILTAEGTDDTHGFLPNCPSNGMPGLVYSIGCNNAAFDMDTPPFPSVNPSVATAFIAKPNGGAVAFVGYSRWGWVATSWRIEQAFFDCLYTTSNNPAEALRYAKLQFTYFRDECYGLNFYGDPTMKIWTDEPQSLSLTVPEQLPDGTSGFEVSVNTGSLPAAGALITVIHSDSIVAQLQTDGDGVAVVPVEYDAADSFKVFAYQEGFATACKELNPQLVLGTDDEVTLPRRFELHQNYPNPFNPTTVIAFDVDRPATVTLEIYNVLGQRVKTAVETEVAAGRYEIEWNGTNDAGQPVGSGVYFTKLRTDSRCETIKMCLMK